uniref:Apoptosis associated tyrosine kinase n=1 Tax=Sander lucioperca TaxID=283035 RepID=A0A8D0D6A5_SANLU
MSTLASPASQGSPDVYILPLTELSLPVAKQPARSVQLLKSTDLGRHSLLYLKEIGNGWFGKVLLGEVNAGLNTTQVVVKELTASSSVQDQMHFLEEARPFRWATLCPIKHSNDTTALQWPVAATYRCFISAYCVQGDVKGYLRSCRTSETMTPDPLILQRMACDIASGLMHMHKYSFTHSDLALRNCLLTADVSVKIGDYGLSQSKYKDDYYVTSDQMYVPLRWIAPELVDEVHGNLLVADQTQHSNMWSLGVTIWELFELGNQPYRHYSDRQVLTYAVREQQLRLPKPMLKVPLAERWYEVMQFCWLQPDQRPTAEEVHLLLSYLCAKGASEAEDDFERRWNSLRTNTVFNSHRGASAMSRDHSSSTSSSFPLLEQFSAGDGYHSESGDDILTVTETSHGLNFEYKWEQARADQSFRASDSSISPTYYQSKHLHAPNILPVLSAHSPSVSSEYYIRIEEPVDCNLDPDYTMCSYSPDYQDLYDSNDSSPAISLTMEPLLGQVLDNSPLPPWESSHYVSYKDRDGGYYYEHSPPLGIDHYLIGGEASSERHQESWGSRSLRQALGELENPLGISPCCHSHFVDPLTGLQVRNNSFSHSYSHSSYISDKAIDIPSNDEIINLSPAPGGPIVAKPALIKTEDRREQYVDLTTDDALFKEKREHVIKEIMQKPPDHKIEEVTLTMTMSTPPPADNMHVMVALTDPGVDQGGSSVSLADILDCSDDDDDDDDDITDDITDVTSGIFVDESSELNASPAFKSLQKQVGTPDSMDSMDLPSAAGSCEGFSPASSHPSSSPKAMDSGYDTENNESPEFVPKEPHEPLPTEGEPLLDEDLALGASQTGDHILLPLSDKTPYRDSAYFSDYENERQSRDEGEELSERVRDEENVEKEKHMGEKKESYSLPEMDAYLTETCGQDEALGLPLEPSDTASMDEWPSQEESSSFGDWAAEVVGAMEEALGALNGDWSPADGEDADEEGGDTDDSDESDEELRTYSVREQSGGEESEDECHPVPIVVSDYSEAHKLRSLLKMPTLLTTDNLDEGLEPKKKTVSFFDDVTVYLFDQESPTKELAEHGFPLGAEGLSSWSKSQERLNVSDDSSDGNISEESAGYEWEDDFPLLPLPTSSVASDSPPARSIPTAPEPKPTVQFSRFTVSPSNVSRFSITHISDSDMDSAGGGSPLSHNSLSS